MVTPDTGLHAAIYVRISSDPTGRAAGVERQEQDCRTLADQLGWRVEAVHRDNDVSAYSGKTRPGYARLLDDIRAERIDAVLAWHPDRLYRRLPDLEELVKAVQAHHVTIRTVRAGSVDLSTASGVMTAEILASVSKHEVAHSVERIVAAKAQAAAEGRYRGGPRPFGFEPDGVTVRDAEAQWIVTATNAIISGESLRSVCRTLAEARVQTPARRFRREDGTKGDPESRDWRPEELRKMLLRPRNAGLIEHGGQEGGPAAWPAIVDETTWRACVDVLRNPERRTSPGNARVWLLSGIARCWCGEGLIGTSTGTGRRAKADPGGRTWTASYRCRAATGHVGRRAAKLDEYIEDLALDRLSRPDAAVLLLPPTRDQAPAEDLAAKANALRAKLDAIAADYAEDLMTRKQMIDATAVTRARLEDVNARMAARSSASVLASLPLGTPEIGDLWPTFHLDRKRAIIDALMTITVNKARRGRPVGFKAGSGAGYFDPDTIEILWKSPS